MNIVIKKIVFDIIKDLRKSYDTELSGKIVQSDATKPLVYDKVCLISPHKRNGKQSCDTEATFNAFITFHTHPQYCYIYNKVFLGIPSKSDVCMTIDNYIKYGHVVHIVSSPEGYYIYHLLNNILHDISSNKDYYQTRVNTLYSRINRQVFTSGVDQRIDTIKSFLHEMNTSNIFKAYFITDSRDVPLK